MTRTAVLIAAALAAPALAQLDPTQAVTVSLTHDDADGVVELGDTVIWSLSIDFDNTNTNNIISGLNAALVASNPNLVAASEFGFGLENGTITDNSTATLDGSGGFSQVGFLNSYFFGEFFGGRADRRNPLPVGSFQTTAMNAGELTYGFELSGLQSDRASSTFMAYDQSAFNGGFEISISDVDFVVDTLTIVPSPASALLLAPALFLASPRRR